jgi:hypothetical protein
MVLSWLDAGHLPLAAAMEKNCLIETKRGKGYRLALIPDRVSVEV